MNALEQLVDRVPATVWGAVVVGSLVSTIATWSFARRRMRRAGERWAGSGPVSGSDRVRDTALTVAAMVPAVLFWAMVLAGSLHGLVAFGRETLGWRDGWEYLVPGTLDGVSVTFALLAFRAVRRRKAPDRCQRVVWGAALASATVNFAYEYSRSEQVVAGGYLGLLSLFGMIMFHEFLDQFEEGAAYIKRANPRFGLRWLTWPTNTFCAAVAWRNYPPAEGTPATVLTAVANLERVRTLKAATREAEVAVRHRRALARIQRREERSTASGEAPAADREAFAVVADASAAVESVRGDASPDATTAPPTVGQSALVRVPTGAGTVAQWAATWVSMCADGDMALGPLSDKSARTRYGLSARQLRNIRRAATSGALRRRAEELHVPLPAGYDNSPAIGRVNGHDFAGMSR